MHSRTLASTCPAVGKAYLTAQDPDTGERWRLKGEIFHEDWQVGSAEREAERGTGHDPAGLRRLDDIPAGELQDRFEHIATNAHRTIETDTRTFLRQNKSWLTISPWLITGRSWWGPSR